MRGPRPALPRLCALASILLAACPSGSLAAEPAPPAAASLDAAREALAAGRAAEAARLLRVLLAGQPARGPLRDRARALLGRAELARGNGRASFAALQEPLPSLAPIEDELLFWRAEALLLAGEPARARATYLELYRRHPGSLRAPRARLRAADCELLLGRTRQARAEYRSVLEACPEVPAAARIRLVIARTLLAEQALGAAALELREIVLDRADPQVADEARALLDDLARRGVQPPPLEPREELEWARILRSWRRWQEAEELLSRLAARLAPLPAHAELRQQLDAQRGLNFYAWGRHGEAKELLGPLAQQALGGPPVRRALVGIELALGRLEAALELQSTLLGGTALIREREQTLLEAGRHAEALAELDRLEQAQPWNRGSLEHRWRRAWYLLRSGRLADARPLFEELAAQPGTTGERARYWLARTLQRQGELELARSLFTSLAARLPPSYYSLQAQNRLLELDPTQLRRSSEPLPWRPPPPTGELLPLLEQLARGLGRYLPELTRAQLFAELGELGRALPELQAAAAEIVEVRGGGSGQEARRRAARGSFVDLRRRPLGLWGAAVDEEGPPPARRPPGLQGELARRGAELVQQLSEAFSLLGDAYHARRFRPPARGYRETPPDGPLREEWARAHPQAFATLVRKHARQARIEPELIWAVMTMESSYYPRAVSPADARGLMQVIPKTGNLIARQMGLQGYSAELLFEPEVSIRFACWYLQELLRKFHGQVLPALAAYNAGPPAVASWLRSKAGSAMDEFVEEMRWAGARHYAQQVLAFQAIYRRIYEGNDVLYVSNRLDPQVGDNIHF